ncbi:MAG: hypothetical protein MJY87_02085 [Fibrobacter sp.]|nr:hypothetical protein [Fibrobacter sp.]
MLSRLQKIATVAVPSATAMLLLASCGSINDSWEVRGGGYLKYSINNEESHTIELHKNDVEPPFYVNNNHSYFYLVTRLEESKKGHQISLMVNRPSTGGHLKPVTRANINGKQEDVTWFMQNGTLSPLIADSSYIHFDEIIKDSLYTAYLELDFKDCRSGYCEDNLPPVHLSGRLRYWIPEDDR